MIARLVAFVAAVVIATACGTTSTTTTGSTATAAGASTPPATETAATAPTATTAEPSSGESASGQSADEPEPGFDDGSEAAAIRSRVPAPVTLDTFLGFSGDGAYGFESTIEWGRPHTSCTAEPTPTMTAIDLLRSTDDRLISFESGPELAGDVMHFDVGDDQRAVIVWVCLDEQGLEQHHLTTFTIYHGDAVDVSHSTPIEIDPLQQWVRLIGWTAQSEVEVLVTLGEQDDYDNWVQRLWSYDLDAGSVNLVSEAPLYNEERDEQSPQVVSPDGRFRLRSIPDPYGAVGCEGYGLARSISIDDGSGERAAFDFDQPAFSDALDIHFDDTGLVMWWSGCEGFYSAHVARLTNEGQLVDQHLVEPPLEELLAGEFSYLELVQARLLGDGQAGLLLVDRSSDAAPRVVYRRIDFADDPAFVSDRTELIDATSPLAPTLAGSGQLFAGPSLTAPVGSTRGCGDQTLYATTTAGLVRVLGTDFALDEVVDIAVSEVRETDYDGHIVRTRQIAVLTECRDRYIGGRIWFGTERAIPGYGIFLERADQPSTVDIADIREVQDEEYDYVWHTEATVTWREGTTADVRFAAVPD